MEAFSGNLNTLRSDLIPVSSALVNQRIPRCPNPVRVAPGAAGSLPGDYLRKTESSGWETGSPLRTPATGPSGDRTKPGAVLVRSVALFDTSTKTPGLAANSTFAQNPGSIDSATAFRRRGSGEVDYSLIPRRSLWDSIQSAPSSCTVFPVHSLKRSSE
jgi:hypothetical protein